MDKAQLQAVGEERYTRRQRVLLKGVVAWNDEFSSASCTVRDLSETGAKIQLESPAAIPANFVLHVEVGGWKAECERVWLEGLMMGVRFTSERQRSRLHRDQMLKPSEEAFSEQTRWEMEMRAKAETQPAAPARPAQHDLVAKVRANFTKG